MSNKQFYACATINGQTQVLAKGTTEEDAHRLGEQRLNDWEGGSGATNLEVVEAQDDQEAITGYMAMRGSQTADRQGQTAIT